MDDQAAKLRQLVRSVRHAATVATGPPLVLLYAAGDRPLGDRLFRQVQQQCGRCGVRTSTVVDPHDPTPAIDWQLALACDGYEKDDHEKWQRASVLVVVTCADNSAVIDCYRGLKLAAQYTPLPPLELIVVQHDDEAEATAALDRLAQTCRKFLLSSLSGTTVVMESEEQLATAVGGLVERLALMAPVAYTEANSPIATHDN